MTGGGSPPGGLLILRGGTARRGGGGGGDGATGLTEGGGGTAFLGCSSGRNKDSTGCGTTPSLFKKSSKFYCNGVLCLGGGCIGGNGVVGICPPSPGLFTVIPIGG